MDKVKRGEAILDITEGGLGMIDIKTLFESTKASWVTRIVNTGPDDTWSFIPKALIRKFGENNLILKLNFDNIKLFPLLKSCPIFYRDVICAFNKSKCINRTDFCNTLSEQVIWGNRFLTDRKSTRLNSSH